MNCNLAFHTPGRWVSHDGEFGLRPRHAYTKRQQNYEKFIKYRIFCDLFSKLCAYFRTNCYICGSKTLRMSLTIYKASAGSGKTFILSATFIAHLLRTGDPQAHRHLLAVTFTNKATAEMKERILQYLHALAHDLPVDDSFFCKVRELIGDPAVTDPIIRRRAAIALHGIIHDYDHFHVTTIDSFFQSLLANLAHELGLSSSFKVEIGDKEVLAKAVDRFLVSLQENSEELQWLTAYIREQMEDDKSWNISSELKGLSRQITKEGYMLNRHLLQGNGTDDTPGVCLTNAFVGHYKRTLQELRQQAVTAIKECARKTYDDIEACLTFDNISRGKNIANHLTQVSDPDVEITKDIKPTDMFCKYASGEKPLLTAPNIKKGLYTMEAAAAQSSLANYLDTYRQMMRVINSCSLSIANLNPLHLLDAISREVNQLNHENDRIMLSYTPLLFHKLSQENDPSFVFERAGTQYQHIMIDEFQDTSRLQWSNISQLLVENMAMGNSCMLVGDVKQGIYRFRGGDWNTLAEFGSETSSININTLDTNFRSGREIVEFNNHLFTCAPQVVMERIAKTCGTHDDDPYSPILDIERIYPHPSSSDDHEVTQLASQEGGFVRIVRIEDQDYNTEAEVAEQMMRLHDVGVPYSEMAVLIRNNKDALPLLRYFEEHHGPDTTQHINLISEEAFLLESSPAVMVIINALRYVSNTTDYIAYEYVRHYCPAGKEEEIHALLDLWNREKFCGLPFYEVSCRLADILQLYDNDRLPGQSPYLYCYLDAVLAYVDDHNSQVKDFLKFWDETLCRKAIPSAAVDGVRILTIHKSKGLAFHSVFMPYCDWAIEGGNKTELVWICPKSAPFNEIPLLPINMKKEAGESIYREDFRQETFDKYTENLNLLYVAFTRPKQNLLVWGRTFGHASSGISDILFKALDLREEVREWGAPSAIGISLPADQEANNEKASGNPLKYHSTPININFTHHAPKLVFQQSNNAALFLAPEEPDDTENISHREDLQEDYRRSGVILHLLMSTIESADDLTARIDDFDRAGMLPIHTSKEALTRLIRRRMSHSTARTWFDGTWQLYRECSLVYRENGQTIVRRPDRVMTRGNRTNGTDETVVVDFKFGRPKPEHREQVEHYKRLLQRQGRNHVRGYLWYLYSGSIEEVL